MDKFLINDATTTRLEAGENRSIFHVSPAFSPHADFGLRFAWCFVFLALAVIGFMATISGVIPVSRGVQTVVFALPPVAFAVCVLWLVYIVDSPEGAGRERARVSGK